MAITSLPLKQIRDLGVLGILRDVEVASSLAPAGSVSKAINLHFDKIGSVSLRSGITAINNQVESGGNSCLGLFNARFENSTKNALLSVFSDGTNNDIYQNTGSGWSKSLEDDTKDLKTRFTTFANRVIRVNGTDNMKTWNGTAWSTSGNPINEDDMASYDTKFVEVYKSRVYTAGNSSNPDRLFFSSVIDSSGNITWTPGTDFVDLNPSDGENITALKRYSRELLIFKPNYIYRFTTAGTDPDPLIRIGTRSQESVIEGKKGIYYHNDKGVFLYNGSYPVETSRPISDFINAIPSSSYENVVAWRDDNHIMFSVGDITVGGVSFTNIVLRYTETSDVWTIYSYGTQITAAGDYDNGTTLSRVVGDDAGYVLTYDSGTTDNGSAINYDLETNWYYTESLAETKIIQTLLATAEKAKSAIFKYQVDNETEWFPIGSLTKYLNYFRNIDAKFHRIRFKLMGSSTTEALIFEGIDILSGTNEGVILK